MTSPQTPNPLIRTPLKFERANGNGGIPGGYIYPQINIWVAQFDALTTNNRAIRGYNISGPPGAQIDIWFDNNLDDSTTQMGTATNTEYNEPHILYRGVTLYIVIPYYAGRRHFGISDFPIANLFYHNDVKGGY